jgi:hypothetical protein
LLISPTRPNKRKERKGKEKEKDKKRKEKKKDKRKEKKKKEKKRKGKIREEKGRGRRRKERRGRERRKGKNLTFYIIYILRKNVPIPRICDLSCSLIIYEKQAPWRSIRNKTGFVDTTSILAPVKHLAQRLL